MTRLALIHPSGLLATEMRESLERRKDLWQELHLFSDDSEDVGSLTEVRGEATLVKQLDGTSLDGIDVAIFGGEIAPTRALLHKLPASTTAVILSPDAEPQDGHPVVAGVNLETLTSDTRVVVSPHPAAVALAHLLAPLRPFGLKQVVATLLQPVSMHGRRGLDELFEQTRGILTFASESPREVFPTQMAFNILPVAAQSQIIDHLWQVMKVEFPVSIKVLQTSVFHSFSFSLHLELEEDPGAEDLQEALSSHPFIDHSPDPELLAPTDAAARDEVILGNVEPVPQHPGTYQLWAVMDNLTCGGALNAIHILEALQPSSSAN